MPGKKIIPFSFQFIPTKDISIKAPITGRVLKELLLGELIVESDNPILRIPGLRYIGLIMDGAVLHRCVTNAIFDQQDNTLAVRANDETIILDYEKIKEQIENQKAYKNKFKTKESLRTDKEDTKG